MDTKHNYNIRLTDALWEKLEVIGKHHFDEHKSSTIRRLIEREYYKITGGNLCD